MKRFGSVVLALMLCVCLLAQPVFAEEAARTQFRVGRWDDTKSSIRQKETNALLAEREDSLYYSAKILEKNANVTYFFNEEGRLYRGVISFHEKYSSGDKYIADFELLKEELTRLYGAPEKEQLIWTDEGMARYVTKGEALEYGYATWFASWRTDEETRVLLQMNATDFKVNTIVGYTRVENTK